MIDSTISHYRIVEKLGSGGMGVVYRARDEKLERDVAIKFLPPGLLADDEARKRFHTEALALARLHHSNIGTIYEFDSEKGSDFLVMECIPGTTLAERLSLGLISEKEALDIASQVAAALEEAHEQGVIHCDLKPGNVLLTPKGQVKVLDFGVARLAQQLADEVSSTTSTVDEPVVTGTVPYMAPEQLLGEPPDPRTDIHAFGALLYEMITNRRAFPELLLPRVTQSILRRVPLPPGALTAGVSPELERIIMKCLEKSRDNRYQSAKELCVDLRRLVAPSPAAEALFATRERRPWRRNVLFGALILVSVLLAGLLFPKAEHWGRQISGLATGPPIHSLVLLPVENLSADPSQQYLADGITAELIAELSEIHALRVIGADSVMRYKTRNRRSLERIARQLHADAIVLASIDHSGGDARLRVSLVRPSNNRRVWSHTYEFALQQVPELGHAVARAVAGHANAALTPEEQAHLAVSPKVDSAAEAAYLHGRAFFLEGTEDALARSRAAFERAIVAAPDYAPAYAGLAAASVFCACPDRPRAALMRQAKRAALRAIELDEGQAQAHAALGVVEMTYEYDWPAAQREMKRAIALRPSSAGAHRLYAEYLVNLGRFQEGIAEATTALDLDPLSALPNVSLGKALYYSRRVDAAIEQFETTLRRNPNDGPARSALGLAYVQAGRYEEAAAQVQRAIALGHQVTVSTAQLAYVYALMGGADEARHTARNIASFKGPNEPPAYALALIHTALGDRSAAIRWLQKAYKAREPEIARLKVDPGLDPLRSDPRFDDLLRRAGIP